MDDLYLDGKCSIIHGCDVQYSFNALKLLVSLMRSNTSVLRVQRKRKERAQGRELRRGKGMEEERDEESEAKREQRNQAAPATEDPGTGDGDP